MAALHAAEAAGSDNGMAPIGDTSRVRKGAWTIATASVDIAAGNGQLA